MKRKITNLASSRAGYARDSRGAAAVEFVLVLGLLIYPVLNVIDLAYYAWASMQVQHAAEMGAEAAAQNCNLTSDLPAVQRCAGAQSKWNTSLYSAVSYGIQESTLGSAVTLASVSSNPAVQEGYYCAQTTNTMLLFGTLGYATSNTFSDPTETGVSCTGGASVVDPAAVPGDYVVVTVNYTYTSPISHVTVAALLTSPITKTAYMRLD